MSKQLETIARASQNTHTNLEQLNRGINRLAASQEATVATSRTMSASLGQLATSANRTEGHVRQLTTQVERLAAEVVAFGKLRESPHLGLDDDEFRRKLAEDQLAMSAMGNRGPKNVGVKLGARGGLAMGMYGLIGAAVGGIAPALAGIGALGGALAIAIPAVAALGAGIVAAMGLGMMAMKPVIAGYKQITEAELAIKNASTWAERKAGIDQLRLAQAKLTTQQLEFIRSLQGLKKEFKEASKPGQDSIFAAMSDLVSTARTLIPVVAPILNQFAAVLQNAAAGMKAFFGDAREQQLMRRAWEPLVPIFQTFLSIFGKLAVIFQGVTIAATPLLKWVLDGIDDKFGKIAKTLSSDSGIRDSAAWFKGLQAPLTMIWHMLTNVWDSLVKVGRAGKSGLPAFLGILDRGFNMLVSVLPAFTALLIAAEPVFMALIDLIDEFAKQIQLKMTGDVSKSFQDFASLIRKLTPVIVGGLVAGFSIIMKVISGVLKLVNMLPAGVVKVAAISAALLLVASKLPGLSGVLGVLKNIAGLTLGKGLAMIGSLIGGKAGAGLQGLGASFMERGTAANPMHVIVVAGAAGAAGATAAGGGKGGGKAAAARGVGGLILGVGSQLVGSAVAGATGNEELGNLIGNVGAGAGLGLALGGPIGAGVGAAAGAGLSILQHFGVFADGGVVNRPTLAMVGEDGPEAIVPLSKPHRASAVGKQAGLGGAAGGTVHIGTINVSNGDDYTTFINRLRRDLRVASRDSVSFASL